MYITNLREHAIGALGITATLAFSSIAGATSLTLNPHTIGTAPSGSAVGGLNATWYKANNQAAFSNHVYTETDVGSPRYGETAAIKTFGWLFFGYRFQLEMFELAGYNRFLSVLVLYAVVIAVMGGSLMLWAKYNHLRFRGMDRRKDGVSPTNSDLALLQGHSEADVGKWQSYSIVTVHHDAKGHIERIEPILSGATTLPSLKAVATGT